MKESIIEQFKTLKVLVIGDVMIDRYLNGKVHRISPEAPVPIVHLQQEENRLGGAANVALNLEALGAKPHLVSVIGKDKNADLFSQMMPQHRLEIAGIIQSASRQTTVKTRISSGSQQILRVDREDTHDLDVEESENLLKTIRLMLEKDSYDALIFQDYNKGVLTEELIAKIMELAQTKNICTIVDPKKKNFFAYKGVHLFKPNLKEIQESLPFEVLPNKESLKKASDYLRAKLGHQYTMVTLSEKGMFIDDGQNHVIVPTQARKIADVCGAGDTVVSVAALALALRLGLADIAQLGNLAGGQVCEKVGVVPVDKTQLNEEYQAVR